MFPPTLQIETFAQFFVAIICSELQIKYSETRIFECTAEFIYPVFAGDKLIVVSEVLNKKRGIYSGICNGYVEDKFIGTANLKVAVPKILNKFTQIRKEVS